MRLRVLLKLTSGTIKYPIPRALIVSITSIDTEPSCYTSVVQHAVWQNVMTDEFTVLLKNGTWTLVPPSSTMKIVGCKWFFHIKRKADDSVDRYKARLVAKGYHQQPRIDSSETYNPIKPITIRVVLSLVVSAGWIMKQINVINAFLHGTLHEQFYMLQPPSFTHPQFQRVVYALNKAIFDLKQAH
jgi:hypothetical protein